MQRLFNGFTLFLLIVLTSCYDTPRDSSIDCDTSCIASTEPIIYGQTTLYIDIVHGDNIHGDGSREKPYKNISYALNLMENNNTTIDCLYLSGGEYNSQNGETFPITIPHGMDIRTYNDENQSVTLQGSGYSKLQNKSVSIVATGDNNLYNLSLSSNETIGIIVLDKNSILSNITLYDNQVALIAYNDAHVILEESNISHNINGIEIYDNASLKLLNTLIADNDVGVILSDNGIIDQSSNDTSIINNTDCDFFTNGNNDLFLQGINWDQNRSDFNVEEGCSDGNNIVNQGIGTVSYQEISNSETPLFNTENEIYIISPQYGETLYSTTPTIKFDNAQQNRYIMVTLWKDKPIIRDKTIQNPYSIVWYWHTGMDGDEGDGIAYEKGATPINGEINTDSPQVAKPLTRGRAYYIAIWEWDNGGIKIISSSITSFFYIK